MIIEWLKRLIAGREMDELDRWRVRWHETRRWLAEFPDAASALDHLLQQVDGVHMLDIRILRDNMRERQVELATERRKRARSDVGSGAAGVRLTEHRFNLYAGGNTEDQR